VNGTAEPEASRTSTGRTRTPQVSFVVLTMGDRPEELDRAVRSALDQKGADVEVVVVGNGADIPPVPDDVVTVRLPENDGIPAGRNAGVAASSGEIVVFLDDDGWYDSSGLAAHLVGLYGHEPRLGIVSFRIRDPEGGTGARRHVPRLRAGDPARSSQVTTFLGGASAIRRVAFDRAGGLPGDFFYAHEETDLAWRVLDLGYRIYYDADSIMLHPIVKPTRHTNFFRMNARNRVWLARRNLPWPLAWVYLVVWAVMMLARERSVRSLATWWRGFREGWSSDPGPRRPMSWRTVWRMTLLGRPPII
jgi:hypothetical protein